MDLLKKVDALEFIETDLKETSPWFIDVLAKRERIQLMSFLNERGIGSRPFYPAIHTQPPYSWVKGTFPNSDIVSKEGLWLPSSSFLKDEDIERVCTHIKDFYK
jgi:perosamine synthetase